VVACRRQVLEHAPWVTPFLFSPDGCPTSHPNGWGPKPAYAMLPTNGRTFRRTVLGRAGHDHQPEERARRLGRRFGARMRRRELLLSLATGMMGARAVRAQQKVVPVIGYLSSVSANRTEPLLATFRQGLGENGYVEGQNVALEYRWADGHYDRLPALAANLVGRKVDVIATSGGDPSALAAKSATSTIPIVSVVGADPVTGGLVGSFARPGGNLTGFSILNAELTPKRLELLCELVPEAKVIALLVNPNSPQTEPMMPSMQEAARVKGVLLRVLNARNEADIDAAFTSLAQLQAGGIVMQGDPVFAGHPEQLAMLAARHAIPAIYARRPYAEAGGLISYGSSLITIHHGIGVYVGKILNGANPADLPVQQPTTFELVVNLKTAKALGLTVPPSILARADEVIE